MLGARDELYAVFRWINEFEVLNSGLTVHLNAKLEYPEEANKW